MDIEITHVEIATRQLPWLSLRPCDDADQEFLQQLYTSTREDLLALPAEPAMVAGLIAQQRQLQMLGYASHFPHAQHVVVTNATQPIGRLLVNLGYACVTDEGLAALPEPGMHLVDIALLPEARGRGIGSAIVRALQASAGARHWPLTLNVNRSNPRARQLYLALDFTVAAGDALGERLLWRDARQRQSGAVRETGLHGVMQ